MGGTRPGGLAAAETNLARYGEDWYSRIGTKGGHKGRTGGFYGNRELARAAGRIGGRISVPNRKRTEKEKLWFRKQLDVAYAHLLVVQEKAKLERLENV